MEGQDGEGAVRDGIRTYVHTNSLAYFSSHAPTLFSVSLSHRLFFLFLFPSLSLRLLSSTTVLYAIVYIFFIVNSTAIDVTSDIGQDGRRAPKKYPIPRLRARPVPNYNLIDRLN